MGSDMRISVLDYSYVRMNWHLSMLFKGPVGVMIIEKPGQLKHARQLPLNGYWVSGCEARVLL